MSTCPISRDPLRPDEELRHPENAATGRVVTSVAVVAASRRPREPTLVAHSVPERSDSRRFLFCLLREGHGGFHLNGTREWGGDFQHYLAKEIGTGQGHDRW